MVRPMCMHKREPAIAVYMPMVREHCNMPPDVERDLKIAVKEIGGNVNVSGLFLSTNSTATIVSKATGVNMRSVTYIPRDKINSHLLLQLDKGEKLLSMFIVILLLYYMDNNYCSNHNSNTSDDRYNTSQ